METWKLLCELAGRSDFLYVADSKLATTENMAYLHQHRGRFITVLPRTRGEDKAFRQSLREGKLSWRTIYEKIDQQDHQKKVLDRFSVANQPASSAEGYRLLWYHSTRKAELDGLDPGNISRLERGLLSPPSRPRNPGELREATESQEGFRRLVHVLRSSRRRDRQNPAGDPRRRRLAGETADPVPHASGAEGAR